jgi:thiol-disulfide isomerase/thioredoxin
VASERGILNLEVIHMKRSCLLTAAALLMSAAVAAAPVTVADHKPAKIPLQQLLQQEVHKARQLGQVPVVQITAEWCGPCKKLRASMGNPLMQTAFAGTYVIRLDMDAWMTQLESAGLKVEAVPMFFAMNSTGRPTGKTVSGAAWGEDIPANMAPPLQKFFRGNGAKP